MADDYSSLYLYILIFEDAQGGRVVPRISDTVTQEPLPPPYEASSSQQWGRGLHAKGGRRVSHSPPLYVSLSSTREGQHKKGGGAQLLLPSDVARPGSRLGQANVDMPLLVSVRLRILPGRLINDFASRFPPSRLY